MSFYRVVCLISVFGWPLLIGSEARAQIRFQIPKIEIKRGGIPKPPAIRPPLIRPNGGPGAKWPSQGYGNPGNKWPPNGPRHSAGVKWPQNVLRAGKSVATSTSQTTDVPKGLDESEREILLAIADFEVRLGALYTRHERYAKAIPPLEKAIEFFSNNGSEQDRFVDASNQLARVHMELGHYAEAQAILEKNVALASTAEPTVCELGNDPVGDSLSLTAEFYRLTGDHRNADAYHGKVIERRKLVFGPGHQEYAAALHNRGIFDWQLERFDESERLIRQELEIIGVEGADPVDVAHSQESLALVLTSVGKFEEAESLFRSALDVYQDSPGREREHLRALNNLGMLNAYTGRHQEALMLLSDAASKREVLLGNHHMDFSDSLHDLAKLEFLQEDDATAIEHCRSVLAITRENVEQASVVQSERQQLAMSSLFRKRLDLLLSSAARHPDAARITFDEILSWKGAILIRQRALRSLAEHPSIAKTYEQLQEVTMRMASLSRSGPVEESPISKSGAKTSGFAAWKKSLDELRTKKESLEAEVARQSSDFEDSRPHVSVDSFVQTLPKDSVFIDFFQYGSLSQAAGKGRFKSKPALMASIVRHDGTINAVHFGDASVIAGAVDLWRESFGVTKASRQAGNRLRQLIWDPIRPFVRDNDNVLVSTDGPLGRMSLAALPGKEANTFLIEEHAITMVPVPRLLLSLHHRDTKRELGKHLLLMGDVDYDADLDQSAATKPSSSSAGLPWNRGSRSVATQSRFERLQHTLGEIAFIRQLYQRQGWSNADGVVMMDQREATESRFRELAPQCYQLHLATHGFFAPEQVAPIGQTRSFSLGNGNTNGQSLGLSPGLLSGLAFSGANRPPQLDRDDGILTAEEIAFLPLDGVELVVLSACETGLGKVAGGEGLIGIQRAFQLSGARTTVASLWKVPDLATRILMERFYANYWDRGLSRVESLRQAQLWVLEHPESVRGVTRSDTEEKPNRTPPQYWAAFVLSGDWR